MLLLFACLLSFKFYEVKAFSSSNFVKHIRWTWEHQCSSPANANAQADPFSWKKKVFFFFFAFAFTIESHNPFFKSSTHFCQQTEAKRVSLAGINGGVLNAYSWHYRVRWMGEEWLELRKIYGKLLAFLLAAQKKRRKTSKQPKSVREKLKADEFFFADFFWGFSFFSPAS